MPGLKLFNTLTKKVEEFKPINPPKVGMYTCGFTVYDYTHIGHVKKYVGDDVLRRLLVANGYEVKHVQNVTDVGHLTSDADEGDDKLEKGAKEKGMDVWQLAKFYSDYFYKTMEEANVLRPHIVAPATEHINRQIKLIEELEKKGFTYQSDEAIYFDVSKFKEYGKLTGQKLEEKLAGAREEVRQDPKKKNPADFALWFFTVGHFKDHVMKWPSPWGEGFPGWHIECSAIAMEYLGDTIDIHTGGIDHIPVHHTNEITQSEAATGKKFVNFWVHHNFLLVDGEKMSKSKKNFYTLDDIKEKGFEPLALRYLILTSHYRDPLNFTWQSLEAAQNALNNLRDQIREWPLQDGLSEQSKDNVGQFWQKFKEVANQDLNLPQALAILWELVKSDLPESEKADQILKIDQILGLGLLGFLGKKLEVPAEVQELVDQREEMRKSGDFKQSDKIRQEIKKLGFILEDTREGPKIKKI